MARLRPWGQNRDVAMLHIGRCGSTVLGDLLNQNPSIRWRGEHLERYTGPAWRAPWRLRWALWRSTRSVVGVEAKFLDAQHPRRCGTDLEGLVALLHEVGVRRWVVLRRRNHLHRMVSHVVAQHDRTYHVRPGEPRPVTPVVVPVDAIEVGAETRSLLEWFTEFDDGLARLQRVLPPDHLVLTYEEDVRDDPGVGYVRICEYLGVTPSPTKVRFGRTGAAPLRERVANPDELVEVLTGTPWAWMADELR